MSALLCAGEVAWAQAPEPAGPEAEATEDAGTEDGPPEAGASEALPPETEAPAPTAAEEGDGVPAPSPKRIGLAIRALVGGGPVEEAETGVARSLAIQADVAYDLPEDLRLVAVFRDRFQEQAYVTTNPDPGTGGLQQVSQDEQVIDAWLGVDWDFAPLAGLPDNLHFRLGLAPRFLHRQSQSFPASLGTFRLSGAAEVSPAEHLVFLGHVGWGWALFGESETLSAYGVARSLWDGHLGVALDFDAEQATWRLTGGWFVDSIVFEHTTRVRHLAMAGLGVSF